MIYFDRLYRLGATIFERLAAGDVDSLSSQGYRTENIENFEKAGIYV